MANHYEVPEWAGKPPVGLHLDVLKEDRLVQKLMLDQKKCYLFGRNKELCDFSVDHQSCSRVHAAFVYHRFLNKGFLVDLGSTHGTFIGNIQIEAHKPVQLPIDSHFHFGHSTRVYILRARPQSPTRMIMEDLEDENEAVDDTGNEYVLDNITEYNTAHNRLIPLVGVTDNKIEHTHGSLESRSKKRSVTFNDEEEIINPEDVDPTIGRFRNLIRTTIVPSKKFKGYDDVLYNEQKSTSTNKLNAAKYASLKSSSYSDLYYDVPGVGGGSYRELHPVEDVVSKSVAEQLGLPLPNPAPEVENVVPSATVTTSILLPLKPKTPDGEPAKKKYAKEAWPGKKSSLSAGVA